MEKRLFKKGQKIILAVSGGVDSVVLLHSFLRLSREFNLKLHVAHLDHGLRESSRRDARFVEELSSRFGVQCTVKRVEVVRKKGESLEEAARRVRYDFLKALKTALGFDFIATAHHKSDLSETMLYRIIRGTGVRGLVGIKPKSSCLIRPLLIFTREEIERYASENALPYVIDETNFDIRYARNFIRHKVLPILKDINPSIEDALFRLSQNANMFQSYVDSVISREMKNVRRLKMGCDFPIQDHDLLNSELIRNISEKLTGRIPSWLDVKRSINMLDSGKKVIFWRDFGVWSSLGRVYVGKLSRERIEYDLKEGEYEFDDYKVVVERGTGLRFSDGMVLRNRRKGDRIGKKKLKEFLIERRVPAYLRDEIPLIAIGNKVVWIGGEMIDKKFSGDDFKVSMYFIGGDRS